jgi:hypothetical protein
LVNPRMTQLLSAQRIHIVARSFAAVHAPER